MKKGRKLRSMCMMLSVFLLVSNYMTLHYSRGFGSITVLAAENETVKIQATIDNEILSSDPFDTGEIYFNKEALIDGDKIIVYYRGLGKIKYKGKNINPKSGVGTQYENGDWDYYEIPYTKGQTKYTYKIYSKITDYIFNVNMHIDIPDSGKTDDDKNNDNKDDNNGENDNKNNGQADSDNKGISTIGVKVLQESLDNASVLNDYAYGTAELTKNENNYKLTIYIKHWYDKTTGTQAVEYLNYNGTPAVKKENVKEIAGEMYDTYDITMSNLTDTLPVTVMVIPMEQMAAGFGTQKARIKLDLSGYSDYDSSKNNSADNNSGTNSKDNSSNNNGNNKNNSDSATDNSGKENGNSKTYINGDYTVNITAYKETINEKSMASSYMKEQAKINVNNGVFTITVYFKANEMTFLEYNGVKATVNNEGEYDGFTFTLNDTGTYQMVTAGVAYMQKINPSMAVQKFRLKIDWSGVSGVESVENENENTVSGDGSFSTDITASVTGMTKATGTLTPNGTISGAKGSNSNALASGNGNNSSAADSSGENKNENLANQKSEVNAAEYTNGTQLREASKLGVIISAIIIVVTLATACIVYGITYYKKRRRLYRL